MRVLTLFFALSGISLGAVDQYTGCLEGIATALAYLTFNSTDATDYYGNECTNTDVVRSMWAAAKIYCTPKEIEAGAKQLGGYCEEYGSVTLVPYSKVLPILTQSYISSLPVAEYSDIAKATVFNTSVLISKSFYKTAKDTYVLGYFAESWKEQYWYMGGMATIAMSLLVFFSFMWFRVKSYEVFLLIHIALSVVTLVGLYYHTIIFDGEYNPYLWPPVAIWSFDRAARLTRWAYCNLRVKSSSSIINTKASASYISDGDFIRLEIVPGSHILKPGPGQHYFLYQPVTWKGWENHPFTLATYGRIEGSVVNATAGSSPSQIPDAQGAVEKETQVLATDSSSGTPSETDPQSPHHEHSIFHDAVGQQKLIFIVRPFGSWTKRLREQCLKSSTGVITPHIFIEGPYGEHSPLNTYENVVFIVGGTGISGALPYLQEHIKMTANDARSSGADNKLTTLTRDITFVWSTKQASMICDIATHELKPMLGRDDIHIHLHATSREDVRRSLELKNKISSEGAERDLNTSASSSLGDQLGIEYYRPDIRQTILNVINDVDKAGLAGGRIAILTCGPAGMADEARAAVHAALKQGKRGVEYFEETFGW
ncbi:hypothetical protein DV736_g1634, partial [Chaetothyriales sp. CBS 134916]